MEQPIDHTLAIGTICCRRLTNDAPPLRQFRQFLFFRRQDLLSRLGRIATLVSDDVVSIIIKRIAVSRSASSAVSIVLRIKAPLLSSSSSSSSSEANCVGSLHDGAPVFQQANLSLANDGDVSRTWYKS
jgi:hypothetical protein